MRYAQWETATTSLTPSELRVYRVPDFGPDRRCGLRSATVGYWTQTTCSPDALQLVQSLVFTSVP